MSTIINNNTNIARSDSTQTLINPSTVQLTSNVYNTINDPTSGIDRIVTASLTDTVPPYQVATGQGALGLVITQVPIDGTDVTNGTLASFTTEKFAISSTPEAVNNGTVYSSASGQINRYGPDGAIFGGFGSILDLETFSVSGGINTSGAHMTLQCMAYGLNPYTSIEFDGGSSDYSIMQLKLRSTYNGSNDRINARSTLKLPLQYGTPPNTLVTGTYGTAGQVLTTGGQYGNLTWETPASAANVEPLSTPPDSATLAVNNSVKIQNGETGSVSNYIELSSDSGNNTLSLTGAFGTAGQVLTSGGSGGSLSWSSTSVPNLNQVLTSGNTATDIYILLNSASAAGRINSLEFDGMHTDYNNMQVVATGDTNGMLWTNNKLVMAPRGGNPVAGWGGLCEYNMGYSGVINIPEALQHMGLDFAYGGPTSQYLDMQYKSTGTDPNGFFFQNYDGTNANFLHTEISQAMTGSTTHNFLMYRKTTAGTITKQININQDNIVMTDNTSGVVTSTLDADNLQLAKTSVYTHDIKNNTSTNYLDLSSSVGVAIGATSLPLSLRGNVDVVTSLTANSGALVFYGGTAGASTAVSYTVPSSGVNRDFYLTLTGSTASQVITLPTARNGYTIYITNLSTQVWTVNRAGSDVIYGGPNGPGGNTSFTIVSNKAYELFQSTSSFVFVGETATRTNLTVTSINSSQLNPNAPAYVRAPADCVEQFGTITTSGATTGSLTFPKAYSAAPCVTLTVVNSTVTSNAATMTSLSATAFNWHVAAAAATSICWRATGTALATL
jgi:hypothetical protein